MDTQRLFGSLDDIQSIADLDIKESLRLEYKASKVVEKSEIGTICKAVTAFANSVGGQFIVGLSASKQSPRPSLDGGVAGPSKLDWLYQVISAHTYPPVEDIEIVDVATPGGRYYIVTVLPSRQAPHQSDDHRYYKRRGSHSEPMEHYEVEDVRNRPKADLVALDVSLVADDALALLGFKNACLSDDIRDIICHVSSNVEFDRTGTDVLSTRGIRRLPAGEQLHFIVDGIGMLLSRSPDAQLFVSVEYSVRGQGRKESQTFHFGHYHRSIIFHDPTQKALMKIEDQLKAINKQVEKLTRLARVLEPIADGTGLRLSHRTLTSLRGGDQKYDPREFDIHGYKQILDVSWKEASALSRVFGTMISSKQAKSDYDELPTALRQKFETQFQPNFEDD